MATSNMESNLQNQTNMPIFELKQHDFIELNRLLKRLDLVNSGGEAKMLIQEGQVLINGVIDTRVRRKLRTGDKVTFQGVDITIK